MSDKHTTNESRRGAPAPGSVEDSPVRQTHFWVNDADLGLLDTWVYHMRRAGWRGANRSACVRAVLRAMRDLPLDLHTIAEEQSLAHAIEKACSPTDEPRG